MSDLIFVIFLLIIAFSIGRDYERYYQVNKESEIKEEAISIYTNQNRITVVSESDCFTVKKGEITTAYYYDDDTEITYTNIKA